MKKILSLFLVLSLVFVFAACGKEADIQETAVSEDAVSVNLISDITEVSPGDSVKITVNISGSDLFACANIDVLIPDGVKITDRKTVPNEGLQVESNYGKGKVEIAAYTARTVSLQDSDILEFTLQVPDDAKSGDVIVLTPEAILFQEGTDETGNDIVEIKDSVKTNDISLKVL